MNRFGTILLVASFCLLFLGIQNAEAALGIDKSIKQVKYPNSPVIYYLNHAQKIKKAYVNEAAFLSYGNKWSQVKTIAPAYLDQWKEAEVVRIKNNPAVYIVRNDKKRAVRSEAEFLGLGYKWDQVMEISAFDLAQYANAETEDVNINPYGFSVGLDSTKKNYLAMGSAHNIVGTIKIRSLVDENKINSIKLIIGGVYNKAVIAKIYLEKDGVVLAERIGIDNREVVFNLGEKSLVVGGGETKINVFVDLNDCENCLSSDLFLELDGNDIFGADNRPALSNATLRSNVYKFIRSGGLLGELSITEESLSGYNRDIVAGSMGQVFGRFVAQETSGREDVLIEQIVLINNGSLRNSYFDDLKLKADNVIVARSPIVNGREIIFKPNYLKINKNSSKTIVVMGGVLDGTNNSIDLQLEKVVADGMEYGVGVKSSSANINEANKVVDRSLLVNSSGTEPGLKTLSEINGKIISSFNLKSSAQELRLNTVGFDVIKGASTPKLDSLYVIDYKTGKILREIKIGSSDYYSVNLDRKMSNSEKSFNIGFVAKMPNLKKGDYYQIILKEVVYSADNGDNIKNTISIAGEKYEARNNISSVVVTGGSSNNKTTSTKATKTNTDNKKIEDKRIILRWPVTGRVNYKFHDPKYLYNFAHEGIDIAASQGTNVRAAQSGTVISVVNGGLSGYSYVTIDHDNGYRTVYGHLSQISVTSGQHVNISAIIGKSGGTPGTSGAGQYSNGPHLHFELIKDGVYVDPERYL